MAQTERGCPQPQRPGRATRRESSVASRPCRPLRVRTPALRITRAAVHETVSYALLRGNPSDGVVNKRLLFFVPFVSFC
jgi:hypothetical protein